MLYRQQKQGGLTLVFTVASLSVLVGMLSLVADIGRMYITREELQYVCEAAALAGAMELPLPTAAGAERSYKVAMAKYQAKRCASAMGLNLNDSDISFPNDGKIRVLHNRSMKYMLAGAIGFLSPKVIGASAAVVVGSTRVLGGGAFPVGIPHQLVANVSPGTLMKIWDDDKITDYNDNVILQGGSRGWLNFNFIYSLSDPNSRTLSKSNSNSDLQGWVSNGYEHALFAGSMGGTDGDWINGDSGVRSSTIQEADNRVGDVVWLPVYDQIVSDQIMSQTFTPEPSIGWGASPQKYNFHVVGFAAFEVTGTQHSEQTKYILGRFVRKQIGGSYSTTLTGGGALQGSAIVE
jgi:hypothetical protein